MPQGDDGSTARRVAAQIEMLRRSRGEGPVGPPRTPIDAVTGSPPTTEPAPSASRAAVLRVSHRLETIRRARAIPPRVIEASIVIEQVRERCEKSRRRHDDVAGAWERALPPALVPYVSIVTFRAGVLHVEAASAPVAYRLDRLLRGGLLREVQRRCRRSISSVKVRVAGRGIGR